ncbi:hypothetical protein FS749_003328 [Ceratobasidium sp. UAMH 11750]|nr:hypothetical protein FS749_003328 [Ceratobasidium sp. UAMH 11750]
MDGNNSLKRLAKGGHADVGSYTGFYFLPATEVDIFQNEVTRIRPPTPPPEPSDDNPDIDIMNEPTQSSPPVGVGPTDGELLTSSCASNWRAAQAQQSTKTSSIFDETGVFLACCRHGLIAVIVDMIRSGELAKYPMAVVNKLITTHGDDIVIAYDIACSFFKTLMRSAKLARTFEISRARMIIPAFHAYAHSRLCQLVWHPLWQSSLGLEDFEWCERVFSYSNAVARCTRHATRSMRHRFIELHFRRWDNDRYASIGRFLYQNFVQAMSVVQEYNAHILALPPDAQVTDEEVDSLIQAEQTYLTNLKTEPPRDALRVEYVTQLQALEVAEANYTKVWGVSPHSITLQENSEPPVSSQSVLRQRRSAQQRLNAVCTAVERLENELEISHRWTLKMPEYVETLQYIKERKYRSAVDRLEFLLLQRLLELLRLNIAGIGYKLRRHISKALKNRSRAIRTAVTRLNSLAKDLGLPQPPVVFEDVLRHQFLAEFDFLRICREDVRNERWAQRSVRDAVEARLRIRRAKEERARVEIEARRLATFMADEEEQLRTLAERLERDGDVVHACNVRLYARQRECSNFHNRLWLCKLFSHPDFDGDSSFGIPKQAYPVPAADKPSRDTDNISNMHSQALDMPEGLSDDESEIDDGDEFAVSEFVSNGLD